MPDLNLAHEFAGWCSMLNHGAQSLDSYFNNIGVRSFILPRAPFANKTANPGHRAAIEWRGSPPSSMVFCRRCCRCAAGPVLRELRTGSMIRLSIAWAPRVCGTFGGKKR